MVKNQKGFTAFEVVIIIVALVAIGAAGYYAYQARQDKTDYSVNVPAKKVAKTPAAPVTPDTKHTEAYVKQRFQAIEAAYQKPMGDGHPEPDKLAEMESQGYLTSDFNTQENDALAFGCGNGVQPPSIIIDKVILSGDVASLKTSGNFDGQKSDFATYEMAYDKNGDWAVRSRTCSS